MKKNKFVLVALLFVSLPAFAKWKVDFSRRFDSAPVEELRAPASQEPQKEAGFFDNFFAAGEPVQEVVILNTDKGFVPSTLRVREGLSYKISVVNVNESSRNVSFVMDAFSEHHATYYGKIKTFNIKPAKEGVFSFICPETSAKGRLVVYPFQESGPDLRLPASER